MRRVWEDPVTTLLAAVALAATHLAGSRLRFVHYTPRSWFLSAAGGVSVAYVFGHLLPELAEAQDAVEEGAHGLLPFMEDHAYLLALVGLALFHGVERAAKVSRRQRRQAGGEDRASDGAFWLSMTSFAAYNALIGYLLVRGGADAGTELVLFTLALGLHFVVNDFGLREHHKHVYDRVGRWLLAAAVLAGWLVAQLAEISEAALGLVLAFLAGGVILNVLKEELPEDRQARFAPFALAAAAYAALLQAL